MSDPNVNDPHIIDGWQDGFDILGWEDDAPLLGYAPAIIPGEFDTSTSALGGPVADRVYLVRATFYPEAGSQMASDPIGHQSVGSYPIAGFPFATSDADPVPVEIRCADVDFVTLMDDPDLPSEFFDGRVIDPGSLSLALPLVPVGEAAIETRFGRVVFDNTDASYDTLLDQVSALSQTVTIHGGKLGINIGEFVTIFTGRITGIGLSTTEMTLELQSPVLYAQNLFPTSIYTGLGGVTGDAGLTGVVKPVVLGRVWNTSMILINAVSLIYQVHDGMMAAVTGVFDGGVALTFNANYASYALLAAASIPAGNYATCLAEGLIRVGSTPAYALTAHVDGASAAGTTTRSIATWLIDQISTELGLIIDVDSFASLPAWRAGWVWNSSFTFAEALSRFTGDCGYYWGTDAAGVVRAVTLANPANPVIRYLPVDVDDIERVPLPNGYEGIHHRRQVRYRRNWTLQSDGELAATAADRAGRQNEWLTATATATSSALNAIDPAILETSLYDSANATSLASYLVGLHGVSRRMFSVQMHIFGALPGLGETVTLEHPRFGLAAGINFRVVAIDLRLADSTMQLLVWG